MYQPLGHTPYYPESEWRICVTRNYDPYNTGFPEQQRKYPQPRLSKTFTFGAIKWEDLNMGFYDTAPFPKLHPKGCTYPRAITRFYSDDTFVYHADDTKIE